MAKARRKRKSDRMAMGERPMGPPQRGKMVPAARKEMRKRHKRMAGYKL